MLVVSMCMHNKARKYLRILENGIYRIQSAFEIMGLNEHTKFCGFTKNRYSR